MFQGFWRNASQSRFMQGARAGVAESFGVQYGGSLLNVGKNEGFLGRGATGGMRANWLGNSIGLAAMAYGAYQGYQQGGVVGAGKSVAADAMTWGIARGALNTIGGIMNPVTLGAAAIGAGAFAYYKMGEAGIARGKRIRNLEMGADIVDNFGTMATMRQRSLSALQNSHVNGRLAMGGEASMMHTVMMR